MLLVIWNAILRKVGYIIAGLVIALFLSLAGMGKASAQNLTYSCSDTTKGIGNPAANSQIPVCSDQGAARAWARATALKVNEAHPTWTVTSEVFQGEQVVTSGSIRYLLVNFALSTTGLNTYVQRFYVEGKSCATRTNLTSGYIRGSSSTTVCSEGCQYTSQGAGIVKIDFGQLGEGWTQSVSGFAPTGSVCSTESKLTPKDADECIPIAGQTVCKRADGKLCYSLSSTRRNCWGQTEVGQRTDGEKVQVRNIGDQPQAPNLDQPTTPTGDSPISTSVTNNTTTTTTTTSNHTTVNGSPAGTTNQGEGTNPDGTGSGTGSGPTDPTDPGPSCGVEGKPACATSSGGDGCDAPPVSSGDEMLAQIAKQAWSLRCSPGVDLTAGQAAFEAELEGIAADANNNSVPDVEEEASTLGGVIHDTGWLTSQLDDSGFLGGGSCPDGQSVSVGATSIVLSFGPLCSVLSAVGAFVMALAYFMAFKIMTR